MSEHRKRSVVSRTSIISGVAIGFVHAAIAVLLWNQWFDSLGEMLAVKPLNGLYIALGMFFLGFIPAMFYAGRKVVSPAIIVAVLLVLSVLGSWMAGPVQAPRSGPTPFGLYILLWVGIVVLVGIAGTLEARRNQRTTG